MSKPSRVRRRKGFEAARLAGALGWVCAMRLGLSVAGYARTERFAERVGRRKLGAGTPEQVCRAVIIASALVPGASCLTQSLAARVMLKRNGVESRICFGVNKYADRRQGHAWLEDETGKVLIGQADFSQFVRLEKVKKAAA